MLFSIFNLNAHIFISATVCISIFSLVVILCGAVCSILGKFNDDPLNSTSLFIPNLILLLNLLVQSILMFIATLILGWHHANRRTINSFTGSLNFILETPISLFSPYLVIDFFGSLLVCLAFFVGIISMLVSNPRLKLENTFLLSYFHFFILIVLGLTMLQDIYLLFICYEFLLLPSFLFVMYGSYTTKSVQAALYFVIWTQIGSFLVLCGIVYLTSIIGTSEMSIIHNFKFKTNEALLIYTLFFLGFGIKIPLWPFHFWLTKTHVEAPSGFSIYLSGFLVKSALYSFFKLTNLIAYEINTSIFLGIAIIGVVDASLKLWGQSDLKRIVAYCTVQEMNLILLLFLVGDTNATTCGAIFTVAHAFLSSLMFFLVDCIYRRFHTRSVYAVQGLLHQSPNLGISILVMCTLYAGLPGTLKFTCELSLLFSLAECGFLPIGLLLTVVNIFGTIGFSKSWFNSVFGLPSKNLDTPILDLSFKELFIIIYIVLFYIISNGLSLLAF